MWTAAFPRKRISKAWGDAAWRCSRRSSNGKSKSSRGKTHTPRGLATGAEVAAWRERMGTDEAKEKYRRRCKTEWPNAVCRNRGLQQFPVRGLEEVKSVVLWRVLLHNLLRMVAPRAERVPVAA